MGEGLKGLFRKIISPLPLWLRVEFLNERSEFRNSGEGAISEG